MAALVLAGPVFSQGKSKIPFLQKESNKQSASVILGLIRLIILSYNRAGEIGPAAPVLAGPVFLKVKTKFHFCKRQLINKVLV